jgi:hypothetical protein
MIEFSSSNSLIVDFLEKYPEQLRKLCAEAILLYGVRTIKNKFPYGLTATQLISVSGLSESDQSSQRVASSCNASLLHNRSVDTNRLLGESRNEDKTERFREVSKERFFNSERKGLSRLESEKNFKFSNALKEPETLPYETAKGFFNKHKQEDFTRENEVMKIADEFLKSSYANFLGPFGRKQQ